MEIGEKIWNLVNGWNYLEKDTIGKQLIRAIDSVAANLSEGFGRYHFKDKKNFSYYSRGSLYETRTWIEKAQKRGLIDEDNFNFYKDKINSIGRLLNGYIKSIGNIQQSGENTVNEQESEYLTSNQDIFPNE